MLLSSHSLEITELIELSAFPTPLSSHGLEVVELIELYEIPMVSQSHGLELVDYSILLDFQCLCRPMVWN